VVFLLFICSLPLGIPALAQHLQFALSPPAVHDQADGVPAHTGAKLLHIGDTKGAHHIGVPPQITASKSSRSAKPMRSWITCEKPYIFIPALIKRLVVILAPEC
jgi:hypothetical protein